MPELTDYLIIGGGVAGGHAVYEIRKHDKKGGITVISQENQFPYDRPPLSKEYLGGKMKKKDIYFKADSYYPRNKVRFVTERSVQTINLSARIATLEDGREFSYKKAMLVATGGRVRKLEVPGSDLEGILYLRTVKDCDVIRKAASSGDRKKRRVVIVGGGFIGCEVAATLRSRGTKKGGLEITLVQMGPHLLNRAIDERLADWLQAYHTAKGVKVIMNAAVTSFKGAGRRVRSVELNDGRVIPADFVVVGVGIQPNTDLAERAGLKVDNGIVVDEHLTTSTKDVYAAGDAASFYSPLFKRQLRLEHVDVAQKSGAIAGANMAGQKKSFDQPPYFFSNQYDLEMNAYGDLGRHDSVLQRGEMDAKKGFIQFYFEGKTLNGVLSVNADWKDIGEAEALLTQRKEFADPSIVSNEAKSLKSIVNEMKTQR